MNKRLTGIVLFIIVFITIPIFLWVVSSFSNKETVAVSILVMPKDSNIEIGDKKFSNKEIVNLEPGSYSVTVSKDGFETFNKDFTLDEKDIQPAVIASLKPVSKEAVDWVRKNNSNYLTFEGKVGAITIKKGEEFGKMHPITKWLPLDRAVYVIGYKQVSDNVKDGVIVTIRAGEGYREAALQEIRDRGIDPGLYPIEFVDYRSHFSE